MEGYADRADAGRRLAPAVVRALGLGAGAEPPLVLGLPRGGVPVAAEVAAALGAPLDVVVVRKVGVPGHVELAMGAIASGGVGVSNPDVIAAAGLDEEDVAAAIVPETVELTRREHLYRGDRPPLAAAGRTAIVVDDGLATGATMRAAVRSLRAQGAARVVAAAPVGSAEACALVAQEADAVVCPLVPDPFGAVGAWYADFAPASDAAVVSAIRRG